MNYLFLPGQSQAVQPVSLPYPFVHLATLKQRTEKAA